MWLKAIKLKNMPIKTYKFSKYIFNWKKILISNNKIKFEFFDNKIIKKI